LLYVAFLLSVFVLFLFVFLHFCMLLCVVVFFLVCQFCVLMCVIVLFVSLCCCELSVVVLVWFTNVPLHLYCRINPTVVAVQAVLWDMLKYQNQVSFEDETRISTWISVVMNFYKKTSTLWIVMEKSGQNYESDYWLWECGCGGMIDCELGYMRKRSQVFPTKQKNESLRPLWEMSEADIIHNRTSENAKIFSCCPLDVQK